MFADKKPQQIGIEDSFQFKIEGLKIPVIGVMYLIEIDSEGTIIITYYKTTKRAYSVDKVDQSFQLSGYYIAAKKNGFADREIVLKLDCMIKTKQPRFEQIYT